MSPKTQSLLLFVTEGLCVVFLLVTGQVLVQNLLFLLLQIFGALLILWSVLAMKVNSVKKLPGLGNFWVAKGPYEIIRHPIYAGLLLIMSGFVQWDFTLPRFLAIVILAAVIVIKMKADEKMLEEKYKDDYRAYEGKTHRMIPYFY